MKAFALSLLLAWLSVGMVAQTVTVGTGSCTLDASHQCTVNLNVAVSTPVPVISVTVAPASSALQIGQTQSFVATVANSTSGVTWKLTGAVGTVDATGLFTATAIGTGTVVATSVQDPSKSASATVTVSTSSACTPPNYCSRTDVSNAFPPSSVPALAAMNSSATDPDFHNRVLRITDSSLCGTNSCITNCGGSGDMSLFNQDSTLLVVQNGQSCSIIVLALNKAAFQVSTLYNKFQIAANPVGWVGRNLLYTVVANTGTAIMQYDFTDWLSGPKTTPPIGTTYFDFKSCLGFTPTWSSTGGIAADGTVVMAFSNSGGQGGTGAVFVASYQPGKGCTVWNTGTGVVSGQGTIGLVDRFTIHNAKLNRSGKYAVVVKITCTTTCGKSGVYMWTVGTSSVTNASGATDGHWTSGNLKWVNQPGSTHLYQFATRPLSGGSQTLLGGPVPVFPSTGVGNSDSHLAWNSADVADTYPFFWDTFSIGATANFTWRAEVLATNPITGVTFRFCHTNNTSLSTQFQVQQSIGSADQTGGYYMFDTDWNGTFGANNRGDVVLVETR